MDAVTGISTAGDRASRPGLSLFVLPLVAMLALAGCNTISGAGKDIEATGDAISDTAEETKDKM